MIFSDSCFKNSLNIRPRTPFLEGVQAIIKIVTHIAEQFSTIYRGARWGQRERPHGKNLLLQEYHLPRLDEIACL